MDTRTAILAAGCFTLPQGETQTRPQREVEPSVSSAEVVDQPQSCLANKSNPI